RGSGAGGHVAEARFHETRDHQFLSEPLVLVCDRGGRVNVCACFFMLFYAAGRSARRGTESTSRLLELIPSARRRPELCAKSAGRMFPSQDRSGSRTAALDPRVSRFFLRRLRRVRGVGRAWGIECRKSSAKF